MVYDAYDGGCGEPDCQICKVDFLESLVEKQDCALKIQRAVSAKLAEALKQVRTDFLEFEGCYCGQICGGTNSDGEPLHVCGWCTTDAALAEYAATAPDAKQGAEAKEQG